MPDKNLVSSAVSGWNWYLDFLSAQKGILTKKKGLRRGNQCQQWKGTGDSFPWVFQPPGTYTAMQTMPLERKAVLRSESNWDSTGALSASENSCKMRFSLQWPSSPRGRPLQRKEWTGFLLAEWEGPAANEFLMGVPQSSRVFFNLCLPDLRSKSYSPASIPPGTLREYTLLIGPLSYLHPIPGMQVKPNLLVLAHFPGHRRVALRPCWKS